MQGEEEDSRYLGNGAILADDTIPLSDRLTDEVRARFGLLPNFFRASPGTEGLLAGLWAFTKSAYLDAPLPSLFKERLFVHLSRYGFGLGLSIARQAALALNANLSLRDNNGGGTLATLTLPRASAAPAHATWRCPSAQTSSWPSPSP